MKKHKRKKLIDKYRFRRIVLLYPTLIIWAIIILKVLFYMYLLIYIEADQAGYIVAW